LESFRTELEKFDLVVSNMTMPQMVGDWRAGKLMQTRPDIPIILCTGHSDRMSKEQATQSGIRAFVMKPIERKELAQTVR